LLAFKYRVNSFPTKIFIFTNKRQGSESEVAFFKQILQKLKLNQTKIVLIEVESGNTSRFFSIESSSKFTASKVGYVIPVNDYLKVTHHNTDKQKPLKYHEFYLLSFYDRLMCNTSGSFYRILHDEITGVTDANTFCLESLDDQ
jgi:hypothetical protein